ncbi:glycosyl hydrolase [Flexivirga endophytica]|uniref:Glycosyl hydrolase n=1 Tax=Flexivirga endophytica TaxID=1849103 RepID=A0A916WTP2_9MICO|nr:family 10 glycosylhydrolase [Flexivirga endophytica]GGB28836.1 glycosyl hydrolase [Flexivirga endophytica]GHB49897.1 glycosyl hydrolase [Flexivirga endophytica]
MPVDRTPGTPARRSVLLGVAAAPFVAAATTCRADAQPSHGRHYVVPQPHPGQFPTDPTTPKRDLRSFWLSVVANIDWPSKPGLSAEAQQTELIAWLDLAVAQRHNVVVLQVRPTADALWPSPYEPWSAWLTGQQGDDPGYDPLGFAVAEAHKRNLELHAWFNPFRVAMTEDPSTLIPSHPARQHPDWVLPYGGKLYYNPGEPVVRRFVEDAIMDAVEHYDIDAVHFDDYFYPYPVAGKVFHDEEQYAKYGNGKSLDDWRRSNIDDLIVQLGRRIKRAKPLCQFGISPFAVWRNKATDPIGSDTTAGAETFDDLYADTRGWVTKGWIDYICPQVYWSIGFAPADYAKLVPWWSDVVKGTPVHLYIGQATYKVNTNGAVDPHWLNPEELSSHLQFNTQYPQVQGNIFFSAVPVRKDELGATTLLNEKWYSRPALLPATPRLKRRPPARVVRLHRDGDTLSWDTGSPDAAHFAVYRIPLDNNHSQAKSRDLADARHLAAVIPADQHHSSWTDKGSGDGAHAYVVSAVDRAGNESAGVAVS